MFSNISLLTIIEALW